MLMRILVAAGVVAIVVFGLLAWNQNSARVEPAGSTAASQPPAEPGSAETPAHSPDAATIGVDWVVPRSWVTQHTEGGMRLATYVVAGTDKNVDAECAVYHFGPGQGGGVQANLDRWSGEFEKVAKQNNKRRTINGLKVATIEMTGTFAGHTMKPGEEGGTRPSWGMMGAIVEGPNGDVFFKLTGPATTVDKAKATFEEMLSSMHTH